MGVLDTETFTKSLTDDSLTIEKSWGVRKLSVYNASSVAGTIDGKSPIGGNISEPIDIGEAQTATVTSDNATVLEKIVITAPLGCTLNIIATT